jgi:2-dehydropantoate 2-reductase
MTDAPTVAAWLKEKAGKDSTIQALQNGIMVAKAWEDLLQRPVDRGLAFYGANSPEPGRVTCYEGALRFRYSERTEDLCQLFAGLNLRCRVKNDFDTFVWIKLAINCLANPLAGILGANNRALGGDVLNPAKKAILQEVLAVAQSQGVLLDLTVDKINGYLSGENVPSLRTDLVRGRPTEIEYLNGAVARLGREKGIPCPANELISSLVRYKSGQSIH